MNKHIYNILAEELRRISKKTVDFGFIEDYEFGNQLLLDGKFIIQPESLNAETIGINHRKRYERNIKIVYVKTNNVSNNSIDELVAIEKITHELINSENILSCVLNIDYTLNIELIKEKSTDLTGILNIEINLYIKEE